MNETLSEYDNRSRQGPIVILGAARSGTKFLRDLVGAMPGYRQVPYDVNYVWRMGNEGLDHDEIDPETVPERIRTKIRSTLYRMAKIDASSNDILVEKSVSNGLRVPLVDAVLPNARYVHIVRDGRAVVESSRRMWNAPPDRKALLDKLRTLPLSQYGYLFWFARNYLAGRLKGRSGGAVWGPRYRGIQKDVEEQPLTYVIARQWAKTVNRAHTSLAELPQERVFTITYEDLIADPIRLSDLAAFLGIEDADRFTNNFSSRVDKGNLDKWRDHLSADDLSLVEQAAGEILRQYRYDR